MDKFDKDLKKELKKIDKQEPELSKVKVDSYVEALFKFEGEKKEELEEAQEKLDKILNEDLSKTEEGIGQGWGLVSKITGKKKKPKSYEDAVKQLLFASSGTKVLRFIGNPIICKMAWVMRKNGKYVPVYVDLEDMDSLKVLSDNGVRATLCAMTLCFDRADINPKYHFFRLTESLVHSIVEQAEIKGLSPNEIGGNDSYNFRIRKDTIAGRVNWDAHLIDKPNEFTIEEKHYIAARGIDYHVREMEMLYAKGKDFLDEDPFSPTPPLPSTFGTVHGTSAGTSAPSFRGPLISSTPTSAPSPWAAVEESDDDDDELDHLRRSR